ncbi:unannotated protein [freshwater metagenome]|uniref:Unannotated protein n=1 Tax=freshwater metagenome TaxID=449393 RepID=A0A6J6QD51_9ZZZZ
MDAEGVDAEGVGAGGMDAAGVGTAGVDPGGIDPGGGVAGVLWLTLTPDLTWLSKWSKSRRNYATKWLANP